MASLPILVYGAGGHGRVVLEVVRASGASVDGFLDDRVSPGEQVLGLPVLGASAWLVGQPPRTLALGIGDNRRREELVKTLETQGHRVGTFVHPRAWVSPSAQLGEGTLVMPNVVVNAEARVGRGVILNTGCVVEHECVIGDFAHISPNAAIGGRASVGARSHVGIGATLLNLAEVGQDCVIGGGAVVLKRIDAGVTAIGVPARPLRRR